VVTTPLQRKVDGVSCTERHAQEAGRTIIFRDLRRT